jgi:hypothetical protein
MGSSVGPLAQLDLSAVSGDQKTEHAHPKRADDGENGRILSELSLEITRMQNNLIASLVLNIPAHAHQI